MGSQATSAGTADGTASPATRPSTGGSGSGASMPASTGEQGQQTTHPVTKVTSTASTASSSVPSSSSASTSSASSSVSISAPSTDHAPAPGTAGAGPASMTAGILRSPNRLRKAPSSTGGPVPPSPSQQYPPGATLFPAPTSPPVFRLPQVCTSSTTATLLTDELRRQYEFKRRSAQAQAQTQPETAVANGQTGAAAAAHSSGSRNGGEAASVLQPPPPMPSISSEGLETASNSSRPSTSASSGMPPPPLAMRTTPFISISPSSSTAEEVLRSPSASSSASSYSHPLSPVGTAGAPMLPSASSASGSSTSTAPELYQMTPVATGLVAVGSDAPVPPPAPAPMIASASGSGASSRPSSGGAGVGPGATPPSPFAPAVKTHSVGTTGSSSGGGGAAFSSTASSSPPASSAFSSDAATTGGGWTSTSTSTGRSAGLAMGRAPSLLDIGGSMAGSTTSATSFVSSQPTLASAPASSAIAATSTSQASASAAKTLASNGTSNANGNGTGTSSAVSSPLLRPFQPITSLTPSSLPAPSSEPYGTYDVLGHHPGLVNLGNTCFLNSILQSIGATRALKDLVTGDWMGDEVKTLVEDWEAEQWERLARRRLQGETAQEDVRRERASSEASLGEGSRQAKAEGADDPVQDGTDSASAASPRDAQEQQKLEVLQKMLHEWEQLRKQSPALGVVDDEYGRKDCEAKNSSGSSSAQDAAQAADSAPAAAENGDATHAAVGHVPTALDLPMTMALVRLLMRSWTPKQPSSGSATPKSAVDAARERSMTPSSSASSFLRKVTPSSGSSGSSSGGGGGKGVVLNPRALFKSLGKFYEQYGDYEQQDCHEVLRLLLDRCRMEEVDLIKKLRPPKQIAGGEQQHDQPQQQAAAPQKTLVDMVFEGKLASMIICQGCGRVSHTYEDFFDLSLSLRPDHEPKQRKRDRFFRLGERWGSKRSATPNTGAAGTSFSASTAAAVRAGALSSPSPAPPARPLSAFDSRTAKATGLTRSSTKSGHKRTDETDASDVDVEEKRKNTSWTAWAGFAGGGSNGGGDTPKRRKSVEPGMLDATAAPSQYAANEEPVTKDRFFGLRRPSTKKPKSRTRAASGATSGGESGPEADFARMSLAPVPVRASALDFSAFGVGQPTPDDGSDREELTPHVSPPPGATAPQYGSLADGLLRATNMGKAPTDEGYSLVSRLENSVSRKSSISTSRAGSPTLPPVPPMAPPSRPASAARQTPDHVHFKEERASHVVSRNVVPPHFIYIARVLSNSPSVAPTPQQLLNARASHSGWSWSGAKSPLTVPDVITWAAIAAQKSLAGGSNAATQSQASASAILAAQEGSGLVSALNQFTSTELLDEENSFKCSRCWKLENGRRKRLSAPGESSADDAREQTPRRPLSRTDGGRVKHSPKATFSQLANSSDAEHGAAGGREADVESNSDTDASVAAAPTPEAKAAKRRRKEQQKIPRTALKRYLIAHAPPVLVIHFKRFQSTNVTKANQSFKKIEDMVTFPEFLDIGPWLAPPREEYDRHGRLKDSSDPLVLEAEALRLQREQEAVRGRESSRLNGVKKDARWLLRSRSPHHHKTAMGSAKEAEVAATAAVRAEAAGETVPTISSIPPPSSQYRLYAVVVHQGSMMSGHYTAYVLSDRVRYKTAGNGAGSSSTEMEHVQDLLPTDKQRDLRRAWVYCSDDQVRAASWEEVAKQKAYLLFYERML